MPKKILPFDQLQLPLLPHPHNNLYEQMTSNPAFTKRNIQNANAYLLKFCPNENSLVTYHTLPSLYICVWLFNTLTSVPIGYLIICTWAPTDICEHEQRKRNLTTRFSRRSWGRNVWRTPENVFVWLYLIQLFNSVSQNKKKLRYIKLHIQP